MGSGLNFFTNAINKTPTFIGGSFGNTALMGSNFAIWNYQVGSPFTTPAYNVTVDWIKVYIGNTSGTNRPAKCAIYLNSDKSLVTNGTSVEVTVPDGTGNWVTFKFNKPKPVLAASTAYVLVVWGGGALPNSMWRIRYDASVGDTFYYKSAVYDSWSDPWVPSTLADYKVSIYAEFGWTEVDVSGDGVPVGSTGAILDIHNTNAGLVREVDVRKNDSVYDDYENGYLSALSHRYIIVALDNALKFEAKIGQTDCLVWLVGYTDENVVLFDTRQNVTTGVVGEWVDTDVSAYVSNATGVLLKALCSPGVNRRCSVRKNGSVDDRSAFDVALGSQWNFMMIGIDGACIFEQYIETVEVTIYLIGYVKSPVTMFTNGVDKSLGVPDSWLDIDLTGDTEAVADGAIFQVYQTLGLSNEVAEFRKNGSTDARQASAKTRPQGYMMVGLDVGNICEGYADTLNVDFYLIGYCKPYMPVVAPKAGLQIPEVLPLIIE